jgi:hypothetical protein
MLPMIVKYTARMRGANAIKWYIEFCSDTFGAHHFQKCRGRADEQRDVAIDTNTSERGAHCNFLPPALLLNIPLSPTTYFLSSSRLCLVDTSPFLSFFF